MMKFRLVKYGFLYYVVGYEGSLKNVEKEQVISKHFTMQRANKALEKYKTVKLTMSNKPARQPFFKWLAKRNSKEILKDFFYGASAALLIEWFLKSFH